MEREIRHIPVLLGPLLEAVRPQAGMTIVDCPVGLGGHSAALIQRLTAALLEYGDETDAPQIARLIVERRKSGPITTALQLTEIVCTARDFTLKRAAGAKLHPAARTFQALRILVNREMANLERLLAVAAGWLAAGGVAAIISFHSGEDRRVKRAFQDGVRQGIYLEISREPVVADEAQ